MNLIKSYFKIWWIPVVSYIIPILLFVLGNVLESDNLIDASLIVFFLNILGNIVLAIVQVVIKKMVFYISTINSFNISLYSNIGNFYFVTSRLLWSR